MFFFEHGDDPRIIKYVKDLAIPIATEVNILDPDYIIIAGGVVYMKNFPRHFDRFGTLSYTKAFPRKKSQNPFFGAYTTERSLREWRLCMASA